MGFEVGCPPLPPRSAVWVQSRGSRPPPTPTPTKTPTQTPTQTPTGQRSAAAPRPTRRRARCRRRTQTADLGQPSGIGPRSPSDRGSPSSEFGHLKSGFGVRTSDNARLSSDFSRSSCTLSTNVDDYQQCFERVLNELRNFASSVRECGCEILPAAVAKAQPNHLGRRTITETPLAEVIILRHDDQITVSRVLPNCDIGCRMQPHVSDVHRARVIIVQDRYECRGQILVEQQSYGQGPCYAAGVTCRRRSRSAANA